MVCAPVVLNADNSKQSQSTTNQLKESNMKIMNRKIRSLITGVIGLTIALGSITANLPAFASGGSGGGGGGVKVVNFSGNWSGTITTSFGTGAYTMKISQSAGSLSGSVHFGAPIFDSTLKLAAVTLDGVQFSGFVSNGEGSLPITGTLSPDGNTIAGTVTQLGEVYTYIVIRN